MKYHIDAVYQPAAVRLIAEGLDLIDCHLLQWLFSYCRTDTVPIAYRDIKDDAPMLATVIGGADLADRLQRLDAKGYLQLNPQTGEVTMTDKTEVLIHG